ncbi:MAG: 50S ribosomal protein L9 [Armatimonadetes bacterium]|nr:50S ribosomal protein L9 [Armatimonadota bacterium]
MDIILTKQVDHVGARGELVKVADGYARNYLIPKGLAMLATPGAKKQAASLQRAEARREQHRRDEAHLHRERIHGKAVTVRARATSAGKLYGSVTAREICDALRETHGLTVDPDRVRLEEHLRSIGEHVVQVHIYGDINAEVSVTVKALEGAPEEEQAPAADAPAEPVARKSPRPKPIIVGGAVQDSDA